MAEFVNPMGQEKIGSFGVRSAPVDNTGEAIGSALSSFAEVFAPRKRSQFEVSQELQMEGSASALEMVKRSKEIEATNGRDAAQSYLRRETISRQQSLRSQAGIDAFVGTLKNNLGNPLIADEEAVSRGIEADRAKTMESWTNTGSLMVVESGGDPAKMDQGQLMLLGQRQAAREQFIASRTKEIALLEGEGRLTDRDRKIKSAASFSGFAYDRESEVRSMFTSYSQRIAAEPNMEQQITTEYLENLRFHKATLTNQVSKAVSEAGGSISDVQGQISQIENLYDTAEQILSGELGIKASENLLKKLSLDQTFDYLQYAGNSKAAKTMLINNTSRFPIEALGELVNSGSTTPQIVSQATAQASSGIGKVARSYNLTPAATRNLYTNLAGTTEQLSAVDTGDGRRSAAEALVNSLVEGVIASPKQLVTVTSHSALPVLFAEMAKRKPNQQIAVDIMEEAAAEGMTPQEIWTGNAGSIFSAQIAPSLYNDDKDYRQNLDIKFEGGVFKVGYTGGDTRAYSRGGSQGMVSSNQSQERRVKAMKMQKLLNDMVGSYVNYGLGTSQDVGPAIEAQIRTALGLTVILDE